MGQTIRITKSTFSSDHVAPDGSHRFPAGLVVAVAEGAQTVDEATAKRWRRGGFAEDYAGAPGTVVREEVRTSTDADLDAQIAALETERAQRRGQPAPTGDVGRASAGTLADAPGTGAGLPEEAPIGTGAYVDPTGPHPLAGYDLTDRQRTALEHAGFTRPDLIADATDDDLRAVEGIGESALKKLRA